MAGLQRLSTCETTIRPAGLSLDCAMTCSQPPRNHRRRRHERGLHGITEAERPPCIGRDPLCPCQDGDACHYVATKKTKAWPVPAEPAPEVRAAEPVPRTYDQGVADERDRCWRVALGPSGPGGEESYWGRTIAEAILNTGHAHDSRIGRPTLDAQEQLIELIRERPLIALDAAIEVLAAAPQPPKEQS